MKALSRSPLHGWLRGVRGLDWSGDSRQGLRGQAEAELPDQDFLVGVGLGMAAEDQGAAVGRWEVNVEHLYGGELVEHGSRGEAGCERLEPGA